MITRIITTVKVRDIHSDTLRDKEEFYGLSTDEKPIDDAHNADIFYEMDTGKVFMFDEDNKQWLEQ